MHIHVDNLHETVRGGRRVKIFKAPDLAFNETSHSEFVLHSNLAKYKKIWRTRLRVF